MCDAFIPYGLMLLHMIFTIIGGALYDVSLFYIHILQLYMYE